MPVHPAHTVTLPSGRPYFRITSPSLYTPNSADYVKVVNGQGSARNPQGARYSPPIAPTVFLAEDRETCFAEKLFYFQRDILRQIDLCHFTGLPIPPFNKDIVLWEVTFSGSIPDVVDLCKAGTPNFFGVYPSLMNNPSQDYEHLKDRRAHIQAQSYQGLIAPSARSTQGGRIVVLFQDQSGNVQTITPHSGELRLITAAGSPFTNHTTEVLDFTAGEVRITSGWRPRGWTSYPWQRVSFHH